MEGGTVLPPVKESEHTTGSGLRGAQQESSMG